MGKIREVFQKMSLKRSLVLLAVFCLSLVSALSVITILTCSSIQKKILDTRPIIITDYVIRDADSNDTENNNGVTAVPQKYVQMYHITAPAHHQMCIVSENLNPAVKCGTYHFSDFQAVSSISICNIILPP